MAELKRWNLPPAPTATSSHRRQSVMMARSTVLMPIPDDRLPTIAEEKVREEVLNDGTVNNIYRINSEACDSYGQWQTVHSSGPHKQDLDVSGSFCRPNHERSNVDYSVNPQKRKCCNTVTTRRKVAETNGEHRSSTDPRFLHFLWRCDAIERWIEDKEVYASGENLGRTLASAQVFLNKQIAFNNRLSAYAVEGVYPLFDLRDQLLKQDDSLRCKIIKRHEQMMAKWRTLRETSEAREVRLTEMYARYKKVDELLAKFARKATALHEWCGKAEENLSSPIRCKSFDELIGLRERFSQFLAALCRVRADFDDLNVLDAKLQRFKNVHIPDNPYTHMTILSLRDIWKSLINRVNERQDELSKETTRQEQIGKMRSKFELYGFSWLTHIPMFAPLRFR